VDVQQPDGEQRDRELVAGSRPPSFYIASCCVGELFPAFLLQFTKDGSLIEKG
jgi:hypothetical protein